MKYNFETLINRSKQGSSKWNLMKPGTPENIAPFSVADGRYAISTRNKKWLN
ncbi:MAG: hypothetical protein V8R64_14850 [Thomasclavelia sp.]